MAIPREMAELIQLIIGSVRVNSSANVSRDVVALERAIERAILLARAQGAGAAAQYNRADSIRLAKEYERQAAALDGEKS
jgi:LDH2 family malate/lactate/ureidoglycolate dehydrogenase